MNSFSSATLIPCPNCRTDIDVGPDPLGARFECKQCTSSLKAFQDDLGAPQLHVVDRPLMDVSVPCSMCGADVSHSERFCLRCGTEVTEQALGDLRKQTHDQRDDEAIESRRRDRERALHTGEARSGCKVLLWLAAIFFVSGTLLGWLARVGADEAQKRIQHYSADEQLQLTNGDVYTVRQLRAEIEREVTLVYVANYFLAFLLIGIYVWSRRAPLPAMITGFGVYLAIQILNAAVDPNTLRSGIILKIVFVAAFLKGIKSAMELRASRMEEDSRRGGRRA